MQEKRISLCTRQAKEVLGDVETSLGLRYSWVNLSTKVGALYVHGVQWGAKFTITF